MTKAFIMELKPEGNVSFGFGEIFVLGTAERVLTALLPTIIEIIVVDTGLGNDSDQKFYYNCIGIG